MNDLPVKLKNLFNLIADRLGSPIKTVEAISGGDISDAFLLHTAEGRLFCKCNSSPVALDMFQKEADGLNEIAKTKTISTPTVVLVESNEYFSCLVLEYIEGKRGDAAAMKKFGSQLAQLHKSSNENFGWHQDNFIGRLHQSNTQHSDWATFFWKKRLIPQLVLSCENGFYEIRNIPTAFEAIEILNMVLGEVRPSLIHGDLWSGNYLISKDGHSYLIDPAVYYGHHLIDISMSQLFGGFSADFYNAYFEQWPKPTKDQIELYQLYYLLVHLNLFGSSYYSSVDRILKRFFGKTF